MPKGAEVAVHTICQYLNNCSADKVALKIDFENAFNMLRRDKMLAKVKEEIPLLYPMVWQAYSTESHLYFGDEETVFSREGLQQGDPLGGLLFSLGIADIVDFCESELCVFYLDDGTLAPPPKYPPSMMRQVVPQDQFGGFYGGQQGYSYSTAPSANPMM